MTIPRESTRISATLNMYLNQSGLQRKLVEGKSPDLKSDSVIQDTLETSDGGNSVAEFVVDQESPDDLGKQSDDDDLNSGDILNVVG